MAEHVVAHVGEGGDDVDVEGDLWLGHCGGHRVRRDY